MFNSQKKIKLRTIIKRHFVAGMKQAVFACLVSGCVYRFTNLTVRLPEKVKSIAIEGVYDTSRDVVSHDILWTEVQRAFASDGHLRLAPQAEADALLRLRILDGADSPTGSSLRNGVKSDVKGDATDPQAFRELAQAGEFTTKQSVRLSVGVEVIDLNTKSVLFTKDYAGSRSFDSYKNENNVGPRQGHFLLFEEAKDSRIREISQEIATSVVRDFLVGR